MANQYRNQYFTAICVNIGTIVYAMASGWMSPALTILMSDVESPLDNGALTIYELSWVASSLTMGGILGATYSGWAANALGRRKAVIIAGIPQIFSWLFIYFGWNVYFLFVSRFMAGFAGGTIFGILPVYVSEISEDKVRGTLGTLLTLTYNVGLLLGYVIGAYLNYFTVPLIGLFLSVTFVMSLVFILPETPQYLLVQNREMDARKALGFLRNIRSISEQEQSIEFMNDMKKLHSECQLNNSSSSNYDSSKQTNIIDNKFMVSSTATATADDNKLIKPLKNKFKWSSLCSVPSTRKGLIIGLIVLTLNQLCGLFSILNYTSYIFAEAGSELHPNICAIIIGVIHLVGAYVATVLIERLGRKILFVSSAIGSALSLTMLGSYFYFKSCGFDVSFISWLPIISLSSYVFIACIGIIPIGFIIPAEILPQNIRGPFLSYCQIITWTIGFFGAKFFSIVSEEYGMQYCLWFFAFWCYLDTILIAILFPETKGKSIEEIILKLGGDSRSK